MVIPGSLWPQAHHFPVVNAPIVTSDSCTPVGPPPCRCSGGKRTFIVDASTWIFFFLLHITSYSSYGHVQPRVANFQVPPFDLLCAPSPKSLALITSSKHLIPTHPSSWIFSFFLHLSKNRFYSHVQPRVANFPVPTFGSLIAASGTFYVSLLLSPLPSLTRYLPHKPQLIITQMILPGKRREHSWSHRCHRFSLFFYVLPSTLSTKHFTGAFRFS
jgi:hypothetical protein